MEKRFEGRGKWLAKKAAGAVGVIVLALTANYLAPKLVGKTVEERVYERCGESSLDSFERVDGQADTYRALGFTGTKECTDVFDSFNVSTTSLDSDEEFFMCLNDGTANVRIGIPTMHKKNTGAITLSEGATEQIETLQVRQCNVIDSVA